MGVLKNSKKIIFAAIALILLVITLVFILYPKDNGKKFIGTWKDQMYQYTIKETNTGYSLDGETIGAYDSNQKVMRFKTEDNYIYEFKFNGETLLLRTGALKIDSDSTVRKLEKVHDAW